MMSKLKLERMKLNTSFRLQGKSRKKKKKKVENGERKRKEKDEKRKVRQSYEGD